MYRRQRVSRKEEKRGKREERKKEKRGVLLGSALFFLSGAAGAEVLSVSSNGTEGGKKGRKRMAADLFRVRM